MLGFSKKEMKYSDLSRIHRIFLLCLVSAGSSIIYTPAYLKSVFYDPLMEALGCTNADLGGLLAAFSLVALICYLPAGVLADKIRVRTLSWVGMITTAVFTLWYAMLPSLELLYVIFIAMGITTILIWWGTRYKLVRLICSEETYPSQIGISYSIYGAAGLLVGLINTAIVSSIASATQSISLLIGFLGVLILILGILSFLFIPRFEGEIQKDAKLFSVKDTLGAFKNPGVIWAAVALFFIYAVYQGVTYTTPFMTACFAAPIALVSIVGLIRTYGIGLLAGPAAGGLARIMKSPSKAMICFIIATILVLGAFLILPRNEAMVIGVAVLVVLVGFVSYGCFSIGSSTLTEAKVPLPIFGAATGILSVVGFLPDTFLHTWFGSLIDTQGVEAYNTIFFVLIAFSVAGIAAAWMVRRCGLKAAARAEKDNQEETVTE